MATIILAGGSSKRMGRDKALLEVGDSALLQMLVTRFAPEIGPVIVVLRPDQEPVAQDCLTVRDVYREAGPLAGLHAGLSASPDEANFVLACDMPFADPELARWLVSLLPGHDAVVPALARGPEPLHAAYGRSCLPAVESSIAAGRLKMRQMLDGLRVRSVPEDELRERDPQLLSFVNVNTPEDYREALRLSRTSSRLGITNRGGVRHSERSEE